MISPKLFFTNTKTTPAAAKNSPAPARIDQIRPPGGERGGEGDDKKRGLARAIQPKNPGQTLVNIPLLGTIAAGQPIEAIQERETIAVPKNRIPRSANVYALRVAGDSMINEGVKDGDTILIKRQNTAENGDKVVALLNGQNATLKTFFREKNHIRLQPANENYPPIIIGPTNPAGYPD